MALNGFLRGILFWSPSLSFSDNWGLSQAVSEVPLPAVSSANPRPASTYYCVLCFKSGIAVSESGNGTHYSLPLPWAGGQIAVAGGGGRPQLGLPDLGPSGAQGVTVEAPGDWKGLGPASGHHQEQGQKKEQRRHILVQP